MLVLRDVPWAASPNAYLVGAAHASRIPPALRFGRGRKNASDD